MDCLVLSGFSGTLPVQARIGKRCSTIAVGSLGYELRWGPFLLKKSGLALTALVVLFGLQTLRLFFPLILFLLRDRFGANSVQVGLYALLVFALGAACGVWAVGSERKALRLTVGGLAMVRLAVQLWWGDPLLDLVLVSFGIILFFGALPLCLRDGVLGLALGLIIDSALHGAWQSYDLGWRNEFLPALVMGLLCLTAILLLRGQPLNSPKAMSNGALLALGPFLFLQVLLFGNLARLTVLSEWSQAAAFAWILLSQMAALSLALFLTGKVRLQRTWMVWLLAVSLVVSLLVPWPRGISAPLCLSLGQLASVGLLTLLLNTPGLPFESRSRVKQAACFGLGVITLVALTFLYYASYDLPIPFSNNLLPPAAGVLIGGTAWICLGRAQDFESKGKGFSARGLLAGASLFLLLPLVQYSTQIEPKFSQHQGGPLRVMSYNLHNGFDPQGHLGLEALAQAIESQKPDVLALQEISRGWAVYGSLDMLAWLSRRLDMPYVYGPTADPLWGNALLSRYPIREVHMTEIPPPDLPLKRGLIWCQIELKGEPLQVLATHFHHRFDGAEVRRAQAQKVLEISRGYPRTVLLGDFNASPDTAEMELLRAAGFRSAGSDAALTFPSYAPDKRIDYVWLSPDLRESDFAVSTEQASDHLGVAVTLEVP